MRTTACPPCPHSRNPNPELPPHSLLPPRHINDLQGFYQELFAASPGGTIEYLDSQLLRWTCMPPARVVNNLRSWERPLPGSQDVDLVNEPLCVETTSTPPWCFPHYVLMNDTQAGTGCWLGPDGSLNIIDLDYS